MLHIDRILVPRDFSSTSNRAVQYAIDWAERTGAELHVIHAKVLHQKRDESIIDRERENMKRLRKRLGQVDGEAVATDVELVEAVVRDVAPAPAILDYADENDIDLIIMGTHGRRGMRRILMGSVAAEVVRYADSPVLTVRGTDTDLTEAPDPVKTIGVPVDLSDHSREALQHGAAAADMLGADLFVHHVIEDTLHPAFYVGGVSSVKDADPNIEKKVQKELDAFVEKSLHAPPYNTVDVRTRVDVAARASRIIPRVAEEEGVDLLTMATHGRTGGREFRLGSVTEKVVRHVSCPVLTVKVHGRSLLGTSEATDEATA